MDFNSFLTTAEGHAFMNTIKSLMAMYREKTKAKGGLKCSPQCTGSTNQLE
ncbi:hypothetical protein N476_24085 [Pseudoalteromonas luteoviolacea H33]|uniref:Uncharacterized protein n=1 Tax=Pseudoalteromonas luteoviolacea H33 TaxID=1365251 RepID=A0A167BL79_9GAMM|nr:hypothetical protein N476_24085 [Pseudoalteromonas luteoviolacea H33]KZN71089.1 hypothetical protein N477_25755 [Pseudoalteromonas luteoviolacea H33-S]